MAEKKSAIVTGGTRGIGKAIVEILTDGDYQNFISDVLFVYNSCESCAKEIEEQFKDSDVNVIGIQSDVTSFDKAQEIVNIALDKFGKVDILVNNAGITKDNLLLRMSEKDFDDVINVNLKSVFNYTKAAFKPMMKQRNGRIVNISSIVGIIGNAGQANYAASKAGIIGFTKSTAKEFASRNITVNAVTPGFIETEMTGALNEKQKEALLTNIPLKRMGQSQDVAKLVKFLCGDSADYITGQVISVDGGMVM
jgi:3-oxoacyl-[acyl-carrier protein] reductase